MLGLQAEQLLVVTKVHADGAKTYASLVDRSVYSLNRHFRLTYSSKGGKVAGTRYFVKCQSALQGI